LDHWLISPQLNVSEGDTVSFWMQAGDGGFDDSISVYLSPEGGGEISDFSLVYDDGSLTQRYLVPVGVWSNWRGNIPFDGTVRFAIRYHSTDIDSYTWYIGIDQFEILTSGIVINFPPVAVTDPATNIGATSATLNGTVNPNGSATTYLFEYGTTTAYGNVLSNSDELSGSSDLNVSADLSGLSPNTTYHYRIAATNVDGTSYGDDAVFTTGSVETFPPIVNTEPATNVGSNFATLNGTVNPNGLTTTYTFEYGTTASYGNVLTNQEELSGTSELAVSADLTGLSSNTEYHYRITATNSDGTRFGSDATFTTGDAAADIDLEWRSMALSAFDWKVGSQVSVDLKVHNNGTSPSPAFLTQLYLSADTDIDLSDTELGSAMQFGAIPANDSLILNAQFNVPSVPAGIYFIGAIVDYNNAVAEANEGNNNYYRSGKIIVGYPSNIQLANSWTFSDPDQSSSYRMIGIPGSSNLSISEIFSGTHGEDWTAYLDNGSAADYLIQFDGSGEFNMFAGAGFWAIGRSTASVNRTSPPVALQSIYTSNLTFEIGYQIPLHNGWNIISNPFEITADWTSVQEFNGITESIHDFNGNYSTPNAMETYKGYYFFNATNLNELFIPYFPPENLPKKGNELNDIDQIVTVELIESDTVRSEILFGSSKEAKSGYDKNDRYSPPGDFAQFHLFAFNEDIETEYKALQRDIRSEISNQVYDIEVKTPKSKSFQLKIDFNRKNLSGNFVYLVDQNSNYHKIDEGDEIPLKSSSERNKMMILIGDQAFIDSHVSELLPDRYNLAQNYPNPFNPETTIKYSIPVGVNSESTIVNVKIFDVLGREVETIVNEIQNPGNYEVEWNAVYQSSGVYFYTLTAGDFKETKKMVLLR
jgi:hypothetical protein